MKKEIIFLLLLFLSVGCGKNADNDRIAVIDETSNSGAAQITFSKYEYDFGKIDEGERVSYFFKYTNTGTADLIITSASASCGCTVPKYDVKPIPPGASGTMEVKFDATGRNGIQTKTVTVKSNAATPVILLKISADVVNN